MQSYKLIKHGSVEKTLSSLFSPLVSDFKIKLILEVFDGILLFQFLNLGLVQVFTNLVRLNAVQTHGAVVVTAGRGKHIPLRRYSLPLQLDVLIHSMRHVRS